MSRHTRTALTLMALIVFLGIGAVWGWAKLTDPFPQASEPPECLEHAYSAGDRLHPDDVVVSVLNAGERVGLAGRTLSQLVDQGFSAGRTSNAPSGAKVHKVQIWASDAASPAIRLLASRLGKPKVVERSVGLPGVVVVVGDDFKKPSPGTDSVKVDTAVRVCGPVPAQPTPSPTI